MAEQAVVIPINVIDNNATTKIGGVQNSIKNLNEEVKKGSKIAEEATRTSASLGQSFVSFAKNIVGPTAAIAAFYKTIRTGISETSEIEKSTKLLTAQYKALGVTNQAVVDDIVAFTTALADQNAQDQSTLLDIARLIASFGVYGESLKQATQATLDISAAMGIDQETAARAVGKAIQGSGDALKRYGINVKDAITPTENLANIMQALRDKGFSGAAVAEVDTLAGSIRSLIESFKTFAEAVVNTRLFGLISITEAIQNISISVKGLSNFLKTGSFQGNQNASIKERDAKKQIIPINNMLNAQASKRAVLDKQHEESIKKEKDLINDVNDLRKESDAALEEMMSKEELTNKLYEERKQEVERLLKLRGVEKQEAEDILSIFERNHEFNMRAISEEKAAKEQSQRQATFRSTTSAIEGGSATDIAGAAGGSAMGAGAAVFALYLKFPQLIQQIGSGIMDLFTDWKDGWLEIGSLIDGGLEVFEDRARGLSGGIAEFDERMKTLERSLEDAAMSARSTSENVMTYNQRVKEGRSGIKNITREIDSLLDRRTDPARQLVSVEGGVRRFAEDTIRLHKGSKRELNALFDELEKAIEEQTQLVTQQHNLRMQQLSEELSLWQNVNQGFEVVKKTISGALLAPNESSAAALKAFQEATGADKAQAALDLQNALLNEFQQAQQAAASGIITNEELKNKQASILAQLETANAETQAKEDRILNLMERENKIFLSQLDELKNIRKVLEGTKKFQDGGQVNKTGLAFVHEGETVIPKGMSAGNVNIMINGKSMGSGSDIVSMLQEALKTNRGGIRDTLKRLV